MDLLWTNGGEEGNENEGDRWNEAGRQTGRQESSGLTKDRKKERVEVIV